MNLASSALYSDSIRAESELVDDKAQGRPYLLEVSLPSKRTSQVPQGRIERLAHIGAAATTVALSNVSLKTRRLFGGGENPGLMTVAGARGLARRLSRLRGAAMKLGQMMSMGSDQVIPPEIAEALSVLRAAADAMPRGQVTEVLVKNFGLDWEKHFAAFDFEPMASASIGQVHRATLPDGAEVALKIQYPGVRASIDSDVDNLASLLRLGRFLPGEVDFEDLIQETKRQLRHEADYRHEAENTRRYRAQFAGYPGIAIPRVFDALCTDEILTTAYLRGAPLLESAQQLASDKRDALAEKLLHVTCSELFVHRFMQTDPNPGNFLYRESDGALVLLDFGACDAIDDRLASNYAGMTRALLNGDRTALDRAMEAIGFFAPDDDRQLREDLLDFVELSAEPIRCHGRYDFGNTDLPERARVMGLKLAKSHRLVRTPPPETLFIQRKIGGAFLLVNRLSARVAVRSLLDKML
ncbi:MAG: AarF/ABC1/UbiB kinase family protein [Myxococcota bacterium]